MPAKKKLSEKTDKRYRAKVTIPDSGGQSVWVSARTKAELERKKNDVKRDYIEGVQVHDMPFAELIVEWYETFKKPTIKTKGTMDHWAIAINAHILPLIDHRKMTRAIRRADLQRIIDHWSDRSKTTLVYIMGVIRHTCDYAVSEGIIYRNPAASLTMPETKPKKIKNALTDEQTRRILSLAGSSDIGLLINVLYYTGMRLGEALGLMWGDINFDDHTITIQRDLDFGRTVKEDMFGDVKNEYSKRVIPLPTELEKVFRPIRALPNALVITHNGKPFNKNTYKYHWVKAMASVDLAHVRKQYYIDKKAAEDAGKPFRDPNYVNDYDIDITAHWLRHNYITACFLAGIPAEITMQMVGHNNIQTTVNIYTHLRQSHKDQAAELKKNASDSVCNILKSS